MDTSQLQYLLGPLGVSILLSLSAYGSCSGMSLCATSSILYADKPNILTYSYIAMIMISTVFFYAFIIGIIAMNKIDFKYKLITSIWDLSSCIIFGGIGLVGGLSMGKVSKLSFRRIVEKKEFFITYLVTLASLEVILVLGFLVTLITIYKH